MAKVTYERDAVEQLAELPNVVLARMENIVTRLQNWPAVSGAKPLRGDLAGHYRIRTGDYRIQFRVVGDEVIIERIGHRDGFYED
jgi:mRNA-degrading endonuclease RelE of RelBE toxin-antitoxin system